jgi:hypothetical protein
MLGKANGGSILLPCGEEPMPAAKVSGVSNKLNEDGDHVIELSMPDGSTTTALISPDMARVVMDALQPYILERAARASQSMAFASVQVKNLSTVRAEGDLELMVSTDAIGNLVLMMADEWVLEARRLIDLVRSSRPNLRNLQ